MEIDLNGDGVAETSGVLAAKGITVAERGKLAALYAAGTSLWRVTIDHFTPTDINWPSLPSNNAGPPPKGTGPKPDVNPDDACVIGGSIIEYQGQVLGESIPIAGTGLTLEYRSSRVPGRLAARNVEIVLSGDQQPIDVSRIVVRRCSTRTRRGRGRVAIPRLWRMDPRCPRKEASPLRPDTAIPSELPWRPMAVFSFPTRGISASAKSSPQSERPVAMKR